MSAKMECRMSGLLHVRAREGDVEGVVQVLDSGRVHVDCKDQEGTTPLMVACSAGKVGVVKVLLDEGADPNIRRITGVSAAFIACQGGFLDILKLLRQAGADINSQSQEGGTPLMIAAQAGYLDLVQHLIQEGASLNTTMWDGATALFLAAQNGCTRVVEELLSGRDKGEIEQITRDKGEIEQITRDKGEIEQITRDKMLTKGAGVVDERDCVGLDSQKRDCIGLDQQRRDGATPLWIAAQMGHQDIVLILLKAGAKVDLSRGDGATPLYKACDKGHREVVKEILKYRPNLGILQNGESCLHAAAASGDPKLVNFLLQAGSDPNITSLGGATPLDMATGEAKQCLAKITSHPGVGATRASRSPTPDKLSGLRSGASMFFRKKLEHRSQSPLASPLTSRQTSPLASPMRNSFRATRSPSSTLDTPGSTPSGTPKHSVQFTDPVLIKDGGIVTKVQCKIVEARDLLQREKSPIRLVNLSPSGSPSRRTSFLTSVNSSPFNSPVHNAAYFSTGHSRSSSPASSSRTH